MTKHGTAEQKIEVAINGRFLSAPPAATYAVAHHLSRALCDLVAQGAAGERIGRVSLFVPPERRPTDNPLPIEPVGRSTGNLWEQTSLPWAARGRLLLNLAARSPLLLRNGLTMVHDAQVFTVPESYSPAFRETLKANIRLAGRLQRGLLTVSNFARMELAALGVAPMERIHVIHNGVDHVLLTEPEDSVLMRHSLIRGRYLLALANTQPHKNIALLLKAFSRPELAGLTLVLAGRATRADFAALGAGAPEHVVFVGFVSDGEMRSLQTHAMAVLTPSFTEGFGLPPVEAIFLGTPAVIAPCGALPEVCGPGALTASPNDPTAWAAAILRLASETGLRSSLANMGQIHVSRFTWAAAAKRLASVISTTIRGY